MALKFLNKKGWHTGSLRNIENVWKAEQKRDVEDKKLEELRKQIHEERDRAEFRLLQEQAGLIPKQERLDFLYESGLAVGKASASDGFKALEDLPSKTEVAPSSSSAAAPPDAPGALFEEKPQSANDAWRKLHSDPLLMIRQREQEALARVKNNPVQMALIRKSVEEKMQKKKNKHKKKSREEKEQKSKRRHKLENESLSGSEGEEMGSRNLRNSSYPNKDPDSEADEQYRRGGRAEKKGNQSLRYREQSPRDQSDLETDRHRRDVRSNDKLEKDNFRSSKQRERLPRGRSDREAVRERRDLYRNDKLDKEHGRSSERRDSLPISRSDREIVRDRPDVLANDRSERETYRSSKLIERSPPGDRSDREAVRERHRNDKVSKGSHHQSLKHREASPPRRQSDQWTIREKQDLWGNDRSEKEIYRSSNHRERSHSCRSDKETVRDRRELLNEDKTERESSRSSRLREVSPAGRIDRETVRDRRDVLNDDEKVEKESFQSSKPRDQSPGARPAQETENRQCVLNADKPRRESYRSSKPRERSPEKDIRNSLNAEKPERESYKNSRRREMSPGGRSDGRDVCNNEKSENNNKHRYQTPNSESDHGTGKHRDQLPSGRSNQEAERVNHQNSGRGNQEERHEPLNRRRGGAPKLSEEERAARLREMQMDAEVHEEQRWKRLKRADEDEAIEASRAATAKGKNFLDEAQRSTFGTEKGGSASIAESVRRRTHYSQGSSDNSNAFRR